MRRPAATSRPVLVIVLAALTMVGPFTIDTIFPAFESMAADLHVDKLAMQQTVSVYMVAFAVTSLFHGSVSDAVGRKPVIMTGCALYAAASVFCAVSTSMGMLLSARAVQGLVAGAGMIVARTAIRDLYDGPEAQRFMSHVTVVFAVAPAIAPVVGGWVLGWGSWQTIFWALAAYGALLVVLAGALLPETHPPQRRTPFHPRPLLGGLVRTARHAGVQRLSGAISFNFAALFLYISSAPAIINDHLGLGAQDFGVLFIPLVVFMMAGSFITGRLAGRARQSLIVLVGFAVALAGAGFGVAYHLAGGAAGLPWAIVPAAAAAFGVALALPILTIELLDLRPDARGSVSSYQAFLTTIINAVVAGVVSPLVSGSLLVLGVVAGLCTLLAVALWAWELRAPVLLTRRAATGAERATS
ncbi:MAG: multidrug effflux MFS transporter [Intrasporangium sp.]|uniref:multidrug effflux MFS transporter n=1 Tax=Intrasporangium sp. TaxID=1925024 RepID=UPI0026481B7E|nr:multidrug effflux MFS transporter [Intrasporangium sp.]MDN5795402.1 multidrug effflux MFS transporter [Intrasporangium sp.]